MTLEGLEMFCSAPCGKRGYQSATHQQGFIVSHNFNFPTEALDCWNPSLIYIPKLVILISGKPPRVSPSVRVLWWQNRRLTGLQKSRRHGRDIAHGNSSRFPNTMFCVSNATNNVPGVGEIGPPARHL